MNKFVCFCLIFLIPVSVFPGEFSPAAGNPGSHAIENTHKKILGWAVDYMNYLPGENVDEQWQTSQESLGQAEGNSYNIVSLGKRGEITLVFAHPVKNSKGYDFAVFENSYSDTFLELAKVYVSTNGIDFAGFETISNTQNPVASFGNINPENINSIYFPVIAVSGLFIPSRPNSGPLKIKEVFSFKRDFAGFFIKVFATTE
jgi:hypothetical protein